MLGQLWADTSGEAPGAVGQGLCQAWGGAGNRACLLSPHGPGPPAPTLSCKAFLSPVCPSRSVPFPTCPACARSVGHSHTPLNQECIPSPEG